MKNQSKRENKVAEDRLLGWLVSYGLNDRGFSYEIRAGRHFISGDESSTERVLGVAEETISSPHLALHARPRQRVLIQDIFSEYGSYITRAGSEEEEPVAGPVALQHGDWLRVGDNVRFQVCLIDGQTS